MAQARIDSPPYPSRWSAWWVVFLLFCAACLSNIDRLVISAMVDPIRADLHISDLQISLVMGLAYGLFYGVFGLALGFWVDRGSRRIILFWGLVLWSVATAASGLAQNFTMLFWFRACVGLGEAAVVPAGASLIGDLFPIHLRGRPISLYLVGASLGTGLATFLPALIMKSATGVIVAVHHPPPAWREVFVVCGGLGLPLAALFLTTREPQRRRSSPNEAPAGMLRALAVFNAKWGAFLSLYAGFGLFYLSVISSASWGTTYLLRRFNLSLVQIGAKLGLALAISGVAGYFVGGLLVDDKHFRTLPGRIAVLMFACLLALPVIGCSAAPTLNLGILSLSSSSFAASVVYVAMNAALLDIAPSFMRGLAISTNSLISTLIAFTGGPLLVSLITEHLLHDRLEIGLGIALVAGPSLGFSALAFFLCGYAARHDTAPQVSGF